METLSSRVESTFKKYKMLIPGEQILVACSGGADSTALFHLLREAAPRLNIRLRLLHFNHRLRSGSERDFQFVKMLARRYGIPFYGGKRRNSTVGRDFSPEEAARKARYEFFEKIAKKTRIRKIALAHHCDDQAETILMRIIQGTGLRGLQGVRPVVRVNGITYIRPFIEVSRREIREFLKRNSLSFREDVSNRSPRFLRNRIRHQLLPILENQFNPKIQESLCRLAETATAESKGLDKWVEQNWRACLHTRRDRTLWLNRERFLSLPSPVQFRLLDKILHHLDPRSGLDFDRWEKIEDQLPRGRLRVTLPRNLDLCLTGKKLFIRKDDTITRERKAKYLTSY